jgi:methylmalonyl-CoA mutase N-terminal domain/subunit
VIPAPDFSALEASQVAALAAARSGRDGGAVERALAALGDAAAPYALEATPATSLMPLIVDAVRARATVGEISDTLSGRWGAYRPGI